MTTKTTLFFACLMATIVMKAQITSIEYPSGYLSEEKITQIINTAKQNGTQAWELQRHNEHLHLLLKKQQDAIANGTYTTAQRTIAPPQVMAESKGQNLGDLQVKQMEKIEELTLYVIEVNKKVEKLEKIEKENEALKKENKELKKKLNK